MKTLAVIQARLGSQRLRAKVARRLGERSLLEFVVRRVLACRQLARVVVATGDAPENRVLRSLLPEGVSLFAGSECDVLSRYAGALREYPADGVVRICADNPFLDPQLVDELVTAAALPPTCDYASHRLGDGRPAILTPIGVFAEWISADALLQADREATDPADREHVTRYLYSRPGRFRLRWLPAPRPLNLEGLRLTVDLEADWEHVQLLYHTLGPQQLDWPHIVSLLDRRPDVRERMAQLNRANPKALPLLVSASAH